MADLSGYTAIYIRINGDDATGDGSVGSPFATAQKGFEVAYAASGNQVVDFGAGSFGSVSLYINDVWVEWPARIAVRGAGVAQSSLAGISTGDALAISIVSNNTIGLGNVTSIGGAITLTDCAAGDITTGSGTAPEGQNGGNVILSGVTAGTIFTRGMESAGRGGDVSLTDSVVGDVITWGANTFTGGQAGSSGNFSATSSTAGLVYLNGAFCCGQSENGADGTVTQTNSTFGVVLTNQFYLNGTLTTLNSDGTGVWNDNWYSARTLIGPVPTTIHVRTNGSDSTGTGTEQNPFSSVQFAYNVALACAGNRVLNLGVGSFGGISLTANWPSRISVQGVSPSQSNLGGITANGANQVWDWELWQEISPATSYSVTVTSNKTVNLGAISAPGGGADNNVAAGGGNVTLSDCVAANISTQGGTSYFYYGSPPVGGAIALSGSVAGALTSIGGYADQSAEVGAGGAVSITDSTVASITVSHQREANWGYGNGSVTVMSSTVTGNISTAGTGQIDKGADGGNVAITDSVVNGSITTSSGGGSMTGYGTPGTVSIVRSKTGAITSNGGPGPEFGVAVAGANITVTDSVTGNITTIGSGGEYEFHSAPGGTVTFGGYGTLPNSITAGLVDTTNLKKGRGVNGSNILSIV